MNNKLLKKGEKEGTVQSTLRACKHQKNQKETQKLKKKKKKLHSKI